MQAWRVMWWKRHIITTTITRNFGLLIIPLFILVLVCVCLCACVLLYVRACVFVLWYAVILCVYVHVCVCVCVRVCTCMDACMMHVWVKVFIIQISKFTQTVYAPHWTLLKQLSHNNLHCNMCSQITMWHMIKCELAVCQTVMWDQLFLAVTKWKLIHNKIIHTYTPTNTHTHRHYYSTSGCLLCTVFFVLGYFMISQLLLA